MPTVYAATYTVKAGGGGNYTTISGCAAAAVAGDTCVVYAGTYSGWTQSHSGSTGNPITFTVNPGDSVTINSNVTVSGTSYVAIGAPIGGGGCAANATDPHSRGRSVGGCFIFSNAGIQGGGSGGAMAHYTVTYNTSTGTNPTIFVNVPDGYGGVSSDNVFAHNYLNWSTSTGTVCSNGYYVYGDRNRFEFDEFTGTGDDYLDGGGVNVVIRNNDLHDNNMSKTIGCGQSPEHADFFQDMGAAPTLTYSLIENNIDQNCNNDGGNCHALLLRGGANPGHHVLYRFNYSQQLDGGGITNGGGGTDQEYSNAFYNNTIATENDQGNGDFISCWGSNVSGVVVGNNLSWHTGASHVPFMCQTSSGTTILGGSATDGTQTYGGSNTCGSPCYALTSTPFNNYPTDGTLKSGSPLIGGGVAISHITSATGSGTSFNVDIAHVFQPGWAGTQGDWIRIGGVGGPLTQITGISYGSGITGTLTVSPSVSWTNGAGLHLYKRSDGTQVLNASQAAADVGAFPYGGSAPASVSPTTLGPWTNTQVITSSTPGGTLTATGFSGTVTWSLLSGTQPTGLGGTCITSTSGTTCTQTGTLSAAGTFTWTIRATDGTSTVDTTFNSVVVNAVPAVTSSGSLPQGIQGQAYSQTLTTTGGTGTLTCALASGSGALPTGLSFTGCTISGTPTVAGAYADIRVQATDGNGTTGAASAPLSITISIQTGISLVHPVTYCSGGISWTGSNPCTLGTATSAGSTLLACLATYTNPPAGSHLTGWTDSGSGAWTQASGVQSSNSAGGNAWNDCWYRANVPSAITTVTPQPNASVTGNVFVWEVGNLGATPSIVGGSLSSQAASATPSGASLTVSGAAFIAAFLHPAPGGNPTGIHSGNAFTSDSMADGMAWAHLITTGAGTYTPQWDQSSATFAASTAAFMPLQTPPATGSVYSNKITWAGPTGP